MILFFLIRGLILSGSTNSGKNEGVDLFINACRVQGDNSVMYYSASFERETAKFPFIDEFIKEKVLISGNFPEDTFIRTERVFHKSSPYYQGVEEASVILQRNGIDIGVTAVKWEPGARGASILTGLFTAADVYSFGRIRGNHMKCAASLLAVNKPKSANRYDYSQESIDFFHRHVDANKNELGVSLYQHVRDENYDDGLSIAKVVECRTNDDVLFQEYWIDPSRGHVCPIVRIYNEENGKLREEYVASNFFQDKVSGLWFPAYYEETHFNGIDDTMMYKGIYKIDPSTFQLNRKIAPSEFSIDIPEGAYVSDRIDESSVKLYQASQDGVLSLAEGGLDLKNMKWLVDKTPLSPKKVVVRMKPQNIGTVRITLIAVGVIIILFALIQHFLKMMKTRAGLVLIACLGLSGGCSQILVTDPASSELVVLSPEVIDFGNVRATLAPMVFNAMLKNNGDIPITILDVFADCGCTVIDNPLQPIQPKEELHFPVKVNLYGRFGDFEHKIRLTTDSTPEHVVLTIKGKVITDLWSNGQSVRGTAKPGLPASSTVDLHTVDYPDVRFDLLKVGEDMTVKELSRTTKDSVTTIKFSVDVDMEDNDFRMRSLTFVPLDDRVTPIVIPVYCYRAEEVAGALKIADRFVLCVACNCEFCWFHG